MISEAALAAQVVAWLEREGWDTYAEVTMPHGEARADIVATRAGQLAVVECKRELSFDLLHQGARWHDYANLVWIAFPMAKASDGRRTAFHIARAFYGFGLLEIQDREVVVRGAPRLNEDPMTDLRDSLRPRHKTHAKPGTNRGGQFTAFRETCEALAAHVDRYPGCKLSEALASIPTHYRSKASAEASLAKWIKQGKVPHVFVGWRKGLYSTEEQARTGSAA